jgi:hypothetical protein
MRRAGFGLTRIVALLVAASTFPLACSSARQSEQANQPAAAASPVYEGFHDVTNCNGIMGWAWDRNRPNEPVRVDIYDGSTLLATVPADEFRKDLLNAGIGNGRHGFLYPTPPRLKDSKPHSIRMKFAGTNIDLTHTPKEINCTFDLP